MFPRCPFDCYSSLLSLNNMKITIVCPFILLLISFLKMTNGIGQRAFYSTKTPYQPPPYSLSLPIPPSGYEHVCTQLVARHGCRALEGRKYDQLTMALWEQAKLDGGVTEFGELFAEDLQNFITVNDQIGYVNNLLCYLHKLDGFCFLIVN